MARILLANIGSHGDVHPFVGLGVALRARGHDVTMMTNDRFQVLVRQAGLDFGSIGTVEDYDRVINNPDLWHPRKSFNVLAEQVTARALSSSYERIAENYQRGSTVLVASALVPAARIAQEKLGIPLATIVGQPIWLRSLQELPKTYMSVPEWIGPWGRRLCYRLVDLNVDRVLGRPINEFRATLGLPPIRRFLKSWWLSPQCAIGIWPEWFARQPDWPPNLNLTGFIHYDGLPGAANSAVTEEWRDTVSRLADRPVVFTPGSAMKHGQEFFSVAVAACRELGRPGLLLTQYKEQIPRTLPDSIRHLDYVPFGALLPLASAVVHHGGLQTISQALAAGIPQLIRPTSHDQFDNAHHISRLGVGRSLTARRFTIRNVVSALGEMLNSAVVKRQCRDYAGRLRGARAPDQACVLVESLVGRDLQLR